MTFRVVGPSSKLIRVAYASKVTISRMVFASIWLLVGKPGFGRCGCRVTISSSVSESAVSDAGECRLSGAAQGLLWRVLSKRATTSSRATAMARSTLTQSSLACSSR